jgi:hypothetical protein
MKMLPFKSNSLFARVLTVVAATVITGTLFFSVAMGLTSADEPPVALVAPALA